MIGVRALEAGKALIRLAIEDSAVTRGLESTKRRVQRIGRSIAGIGASLVAVGAIGVTLFTPTIKAASDLEETMSKFSVVFGDATDDVKSWGDGLAQQIGRSEKLIAEFLGNNQDLFVPLGFDAKSAETISKILTQLTFDLASFNNKQDDRVFRDLQSAFVGTGETMAKYGVVIRESTIAQELLNKSIDPKTATLQQKALAKLSIILRDTTAAQGDAARTSDSFANQLKRLEGNVAGISSAIGSAIVPALSDFLQKVNAFGGPLRDFIRNNESLIQGLAVGVAATAGLGAVTLAVAGSVTILGSAVGALSTAIAFLSTPVGAGVATLTLLAAVSADLKTVMQDLSDFVKRDFNLAFEGLSDALTGLDFSLAGKIVGQTFLIGFVKSIDDAADTVVTALGAFLGPQFAGATEFAGDLAGGASKLGTDLIVERLRSSLIDLRQEARETARAVQEVGGEPENIESVAGAVDKLGGLFDKLGKSANGASSAISEETKKIEADAQRLVEQTATPYEKFLKKRQEINDLFEKGAISGVTADRGLKAAADEFKRTDEAQQKIIENEKRLKQVQQDRLDGLRTTAESIAESVKTPAERIQEEIRKLQEVAEAGLLSPEQFDRAAEAIEKKKQELTGAADAFQVSLSGLGPLLGGKLAEQVFGQNSTDSLQKQMIDAQKANVAVVKKIERNTREQGARFQ